MTTSPGWREPLTSSAFTAKPDEVVQLNIGNRLVYRLLMATDIQAYSRRDAMEQLRTQQEFDALLDIAADGSGLDRGRWQKQVGGDGELAVLPEDVDVTQVVGRFAGELATALARLNRNRLGRPPLRVRLALHHGTLAPGPFGPAGDAPIVVSRLLDAKPLRRLLQEQPDRDLAFAVSDSLYRDVVDTGFCGLDPAGFRPVRLTSKGLRHRGFIYVRPWDASSPGGDERAPADAAALIGPA